MPRVLVVDDNRLILMLLAKALRDEGHQVYEAEDGVEALDMFQLYTPDLIVTDYYMPNMNGAELVRRIRQSSPVPVIGLAGTSQSERSLTEAGANMFLAKPFKEQQLLDAVTRALTEDPAKRGGSNGPATTG